MDRVLDASAVPGTAVTGQNDTPVVSAAAGGFTTTAAVPYFVVSATLVARTVTLC